jgi:protein ImuA
MIDELRQSLQRLQRPAGLANGPAALPLGVPAIDLALGGGLARGALHEISAAGEAHVAAAAGFAVGVTAAQARLVWIAEDMALAESGAPYGPGLDAFGLAPERLLTVAAAHRRDLLWAMEEALRCRAIAAVIGELRGHALDGVAVRRLSLAAAESGALALLLRAAPPRNTSTAATRWVVSAAPSSFAGELHTPFIPAQAGIQNDPSIRHSGTGSPLSRGRTENFSATFAVRLTRNRRGPLGAWILQWSDDDERFVLATHAQPVAVPAADRPHRQESEAA